MTDTDTQHTTTTKGSTMKQDKEQNRRPVMPALTAGLAGLAVAVAGVGVAVVAHTATQTQEVAETVDRQLSGGGGTAPTARWMLREVHRGMDPTVVISAGGGRTEVHVQSTRIGDEIELHGLDPTFRPEVWEPADDEPGTLTYQATPDNWHDTGWHATRTIEIWHGQTENLPDDFQVTIYRAGEVVDRLVVGDGA